MRLVVFDLDHTLLKVNSSFWFGRFLYRSGFFSLRDLMGALIDYVSHRRLGMAMNELHRRSFQRLFLGRRLGQIELLADQFLLRFFEKMLNRSIVERLAAALSSGDLVLLLSSSPDFLVKKIADRFKIAHWFASCYLIDEKGCFASLGKVMDGEEKASTLIAFAESFQIVRRDITVYTDSYLDLPMLEFAGEVIAVEPDRKLRRLCRRNNWLILKEG